MPRKKYWGPLADALKEQNLEVDVFANKVGLRPRALTRLFEGDTKRFNRDSVRAAALYLKMDIKEVDALTKSQWQYGQADKMSQPFRVLARYYRRYSPDNLPPLEMLVDAGVSRQRVTTVMEFLTELLEILPEGLSGEEKALIDVLKAISKGSSDDDEDEAATPVIAAEEVQTSKAKATPKKRIPILRIPKAS